jgi:hypothetical protein
MPIGGIGRGYRGDELWSSAACADVDGDGDVDVYVPQIYRHIAYARGILYLNRGDATFEVWKPTHGEWPIGCYGAAWADVDGDGDPDLVTGGTDVVNGQPRLHLYLNRTEGGRRVGFRLRGRGPNPSAIGARLRLLHGDRVLVRHRDGATGAQGQQNDPVLRFGLGEAERARAIVWWPSGLVQDLGEVEAGRIHDVVEPKARRPSATIRTVGEAKAGEPVRLRVSLKGSAAGHVVSWDLDGDHRFDAEGLAAVLPAGEAGKRPVSAFVRRRRTGLGVLVRRMIEVE